MTMAAVHLAADEPAPARRLRVAVLNRRFMATGGGAERYSIALVEHLAAQHEMHVFAEELDHHWPGVTYHRVSCPTRKPRWVNQLWYATVTWWATRKGFDVVHSHENTWHGNVQTMHVLPVRFNLLNGLSGWRLGLRWLKIVTSPRLLVYLALEGARFSLKRPRVVVLASQTLVAQVVQAYPHCQSAIQVITPGVERVPGAASAQEKLAARALLGLPPSAYCLLFVGNDYRKKGLETLLAALVQLPPDCCLAVVGNAEQLPAFKAQAKALGLLERVFFLGPMRDVGPAYVAADCLAHPTREDTFAMVVLEAMAHGLPVVVSSARYCGIAALLRAGQDALVLGDPYDASALAGALVQVERSAELKFRLQKGAITFARQHQWAALAKLHDLSYQLLKNELTECRKN